VNWMRLKEQPLERARLRASIVLPTPGTSSISRWPPHISVISASSTCSRLPMITLSTFSTIFWAVSLGSKAGRLRANLPSKRQLAGFGSVPSRPEYAPLCNLTIDGL
jgi:hypothetical protein